MCIAVLKERCTGKNIIRLLGKSRVSAAIYAFKLYVKLVGAEVAELYTDYEVMWVRTVFTAVT